MFLVTFGDANTIIFNHNNQLIAGYLCVKFNKGVFALVFDGVADQVDDAVF